MMFGKNVQRQMIAGIAALLMSSLTIGATVMPTDSVAAPIGQAIYA